ncbi:hypothetical protein ORI20_01120 [Mycobacterium sp. CVI_P3]|uniref:Uncharacterized protein n=1 Tax=Mycobacterium pinniadriaticum TaxID=2994102 RepID=A0ABT3S7E2_9MYCO|nr:hypothetical protein [Mycobacterium pinniadriaticum]MCX2928856.1 hypothetical protein [Mycobacterium pinniadriaticum]MCX2935277.1 hypothetical protein [Mycobacterium pinniadriaticum]
MTSMTMYDSWTAPTMLSLWTEPESKQAKVVRQASKWVAVVDTTVTVLCPPVVSACAIFAAMMWPAHLPADLIGHAATSVPMNAQAQAGGPVR